jgi:hypothetical protein
MNSIRNVASLFQNLRKTVYKGKYKTNLMADMSDYAYQRIPDVMMGIYKKIYNDIECGQYTHSDLVNFFVCDNFIGKQTPIFEFRAENILNTKSEFTARRLHQDIEFMKVVNSTLKFDSIGRYFKLNSDGENLLYPLVLDKKISPHFYIKFGGKTLTNLSENSKLKTVNFYKFENLLNVINNYKNLSNNKMIKRTKKEAI